MAIILAPLLSRVYSPADFGIYTIVLSLVMTFGAVAALRFELAVPLPEKETDVFSLTHLGLLASFTTTFFGLVVIGIAGSSIANAFHEPKLMPWLWFAPAVSGIVGVFAVLNQLAVRRRRYSAIGRRNVIQSVATISTQILLGALRIRPGGLIAGLGIGQAVGALSLLHGSGMASAEARTGRSLQKMADTALRYRRFPTFLAPSGLINAAGLYLPALLIAFYYGVEVAGWLGLTQRILSLPVALIGTAVGQVYLGEISHSVHKDKSRVASTFRVTTTRLALLGLVIATTLLLGGPFLFRVVFGQTWSERGHYAQAMALGLAAQLVASPVSMTLIVFERQLAQVVWDTGRLCATALAVISCRALGGSALSAVWAFGLASFFPMLRLGCFPKLQYSERRKWGSDIDGETWPRCKSPS